VKNLRIIILTGSSGAGKSTALSAFEDTGFYCVDNMPVSLLPSFINLPFNSVTNIDKLAFVMDLRENDFLSKYKSVFELLKKKGYDLKILFFDADQEVLVQRFSQTRRQHPLSNQKEFPFKNSLLYCIKAEQQLLKKLKAEANKIINTSHYNIHELKSIIFDIAKKGKKSNQIRINILSFGFKYGIPHQADIIMDVRFLKNPYFISQLKPLDGKNKHVRKYVLDNQEAQIFLKKYLDLLDYLIPLYEKEGKAYLSIAIGCTGGKHRSVTIARSIHDHISSTGRKIEITHRDIKQSLEE